MGDARVAWAKEGAPSFNSRVNVLVVRGFGAAPSFFATCHTLSDFLDVTKKELRAVVDQEVEPCWVTRPGQRGAVEGEAVACVAQEGCVRTQPIHLLDIHGCTKLGDQMEARVSVTCFSVEQPAVFGE
jgi:hypothetical protein